MDYELLLKSDSLSKRRLRMHEHEFITILIFSSNGKNQASGRGEIKLMTSVVLGAVYKMY